MGIRIDGSTGSNVASCMSCGEEVYADLLALANHDIVNLPDGRTKVYSRDFGRTVHLCSPARLAEQCEAVVAEATSLLV